jgi:hypothetical protein
MSCGTLWIQYGIRDIARMKDPIVIHYAYFSALCSKNIISGSCQYTQKRIDKYWMLELDIAVGRERCFINFWHRTATFTPDRCTKFVSSFFCSVCSNALRQEKKFLWRVMYVYMGFTTPFFHTWVNHIVRSTK